MNFRRRGSFKEKLYCLDKIISSFFDRISLTGNIQFRAQRHIAVAFLFNNDSKTSLGFHAILLERHKIRKYIRHVADISFTRPFYARLYLSVAKLL